MKKTRTTLLIILSIILAFGLMFTGCQKEEPSDEPTKATQEANEETNKEAPTEAKEEIEEVELIWYTQQSTAKDNSLVADEMNKILAEKMNTTVKFITADEGTLEQKFSVVLASGEQCDIMWTSGHRNDIFTNISKGAFMPLNDLLEQYGTHLTETIPEYVWSALTVKDKIYAVSENGRFTMDPTLLLRKDIVDSVDFDMSTVETIMDLPPLFDKILEKYPDKICLDASKGFFLSYPISNVYDRVEKYSTVGAEIGTTDITAQFYTEYGQQLLKTAEEWYNAGYFDPNVNAVTDTSADKKSGKLIGWFTMLAYEGQGSDGMLSSYGTEAYEIPCNASAPLVATATVTGSLQAIPVSAKYPERAMMVLDFMFSDSQMQDLVSYGIEGVHYSVNENGTIKQISTDYFPLSAINNVEAVSVLETQPIDYAEKVKAYNLEGVESKMMGFSYDSSETAHLLAATKSVWDEYFTSLAGGMLEYDKYYPEFVAKMEQAGIKDLMADVQAQLDEYLANK